MATAQAPTVGFVTTCRGRLHHLQQTIPLIVAEQPDEIIVVDHDCPQGTGDWLEKNYPKVIVARVRDGAPFNVARARNIGIRLSTSDVLCVIDADILVRPGFAAWIRRHARGARFFRQAPLEGKRALQTWGTMVCPRPRLLEVGLYDEAFDGWGGEDDDLYWRLKVAGTSEESFPFEAIQAISHDEAERFAEYREKERDTHLVMNRLYLQAKRALHGFVQPRGDLPLDMRKQIRAEVKRALLNPKDGRARLKLRLPDKRRLLKNYAVERCLTLELNVDSEGFRSAPRS